LPILKSQASVVAEILQGHPQILGNPLAQFHAHFFEWDVMMGLGKPQLHARFEVAIRSQTAEILKGNPQI